MSEAMRPERAHAKSAVEPTAAGQAGAEGAADDGLVVEGGSGMPEWVDVVFPWAASVMLHIGVGLLLGFMALFAIKAAKDQEADRAEIVIPTSNYQDPGLGTPGGVPHPGTGGDPSRDAAQLNMKDVVNQDGWAQKQADVNAAGMLEGDSSDAVTDVIARGSGRSIGGVGKGGIGQGEGGPLAPYGTPGGGTGIGPKSNFYGTGGGAFKIVYILDHSGSLIDNFSFLQQEVTKSVNGLVPAQQFSVIVFAGLEEGVDVLTPGTGLQRALPDVKRSFAGKMAEVVAKGKNDDQLEPFLTAFKKAFEMKPQLVYFLTDGRFDDRLIAEVGKLNTDKKVKINTIAFVNNSEKEYQDQLRKMAKDSGGTFKFVAEKELGK